MRERKKLAVLLLELTHASSILLEKSYYHILSRQVPQTVDPSSALRYPVVIVPRSDCVLLTGQTSEIGLTEQFLASWSHCAHPEYISYPEFEDYYEGTLTQLVMATSTVYFLITIPNCPLWSLMLGLHKEVDFSGCISIRQHRVKSKHQAPNSSFILES